MIELPEMPLPIAALPRSLSRRFPSVIGGVVSDATALATFSLASAHNQIVSIVRMPFWAMSLFNLLFKPVASTRVFTLSDDLHVIDVNAVSMDASSRSDMVNCHIWRDVSVRSKPRLAMCVFLP